MGSVDIRLPTATAKMWILTYNETDEILKRGLTVRARMLGEKLQSEMTRVKRMKEPQIYFYSRRPTQIQTTFKSEENVDGEEFFVDFLNHFKQKTMNFFKNVFWNPRVMSCFKKSLEEFELNEPPRIINMHFGGETFVYKLI